MAERIGNEADAYLIASAPDLLAILERCAADLEAELEHRYRGGLKEYPSLRADFEADMEPVRAARAALARARGEPGEPTRE